MSGDIVIELLVAVVLFAVVVRGIWVTPRMWRDDYEWSWDRRDIPNGWGLGDAMWKAFARLPPVSCVLAGLTAVALVLLRVSGGAGALQLSLNIVLYAWFACFCIAWMIVLFNRPRWAVVPHLRQQPGAVVAWWRHLRGRGATDASGS